MENIFEVLKCNVVQFSVSLESLGELIEQIIKEDIGVDITYELDFKINYRDTFEDLGFYYLDLNFIFDMENKDREKLIQNYYGGNDYLINSLLEKNLGVAKDSVLVHYVYRNSQDTALIEIDFPEFLKIKDKFMY